MSLSADEVDERKVSSAAWFQRSWRLKMLTLPLFLVPLTLMTIHLVSTVQHYQRNPRTVEQEMSLATAHFPVLRFCKTQVLANDKLRLLQQNVNVKRPHHLPPIRLRNYDYLLRISDYLWRVMNVTRGRMIIEALRKMAFEEDYYTWPAEEVIYCRFKGQRCSHTNFIVEKHPQFYICFRFVPPLLGANRNLEDSESGLKLYLANWHTTQFSRNDFSVDTQGMFVALDPRDVQPRMSTKVYHLSGQSFNFVKILGYKSYETLPDNPEHPCVSREKEKNVTYIVDWHTEESITFKSTRDDCRIGRMQQLLLETCGCLNLNLFVPWELRHEPGCMEIPHFFLTYDTTSNLTYNSTRSDWLMWYGNTSYWYREEANNAGLVARYTCYVQTSQQLFARLEAMERQQPCLPNCFTEEYSAVKETMAMSSAKMKLLTGTYFMPILRSDPTLFRNLQIKSELYVNVVMDEAKPFIVKEVWAYTFKAFMSDVGGLSGLWIGFSVAHVILWSRFVVSKMVLLRWSYLRTNKQTMQQPTDIPTTKPMANSMTISGFQELAVEPVVSSGQHEEPSLR